MFLEKGSTTQSASRTESSRDTVHKAMIAHVGYVQPGGRNEQVTMLQKTIWTLCYIEFVYILFYVHPESKSMDFAS